MHQTDFSKIRILYLDFDGVLTDNKVIVGAGGEEFVSCDRSDSLGLAYLAQAGVPVVVISREAHSVVRARCKKLNIPCLDAVLNKQAALAADLLSREIDPENACFIGNDHNDADCLQFVGIGVITADAHPSVRGLPVIQTERRGGDGAVREICDRILAAHSHADA